MQSSRLYPVGANVIIRDTEWRITSVNACDMSDYRLSCVGVSDLVRGKKESSLQA